jgi:hypothetical protein
MTMQGAQGRGKQRRVGRMKIKQLVGRMKMKQLVGRIMKMKQLVGSSRFLSQTGGLD